MCPLFIGWDASMGANGTLRPPMTTRPTVILTDAVMALSAKSMASANTVTVKSDPTLEVMRRLQTGRHFFWTLRTFPSVRWCPVFTPSFATTSLSEAILRSSDRWPGSEHLSISEFFSSSLTRRRKVFYHTYSPMPSLYLPPYWYTDLKKI
ncbi:hypothetical protein MVEN_00341900 [Mycena venus]|uniref:Uncharacterized protein n=1 Tax=Mycena venus TaxID=2733690 RepID=A0A8H7DAK8_9AGAR|nr:hypothetical protein MVEN_00341900 [Mycena venus]